MVASEGRSRWLAASQTSDWLFDLESRGDAALYALPAALLAGKEREHLWSCSR
jgi:hypothetical protein